MNIWIKTTKHISKPNFNSYGYLGIRTSRMRIYIWDEKVYLKRNWTQWPVMLQNQDSHLTCWVNGSRHQLRLTSCLPDKYHMRHEAWQTPHSRLHHEVHHDVYVMFVGSNVKKQKIYCIYGVTHKKPFKWNEIDNIFARDKLSSHDKKKPTN